MKNILIAIVVILVVAGGWYLLSSSKDNEGGLAEGIAAIVNGESISISDLELAQLQIANSRGLDPTTLTTAQVAELKSQALDTLISQTLLRQATVKSGITVSRDEIDAQMKIAREQFENESAFSEALVAQGLTEETLLSNLERELTVQAYLFQTLNLSSVTASEEEIQAAYDSAIVGAEDAPSLEESHDQIEQFVIGQKQQELINDHIQKLKDEADIEQIQ